MLNTFVFVFKPLAAILSLPSPDTTPDVTASARMLSNKILDKTNVIYLLE